MQLGVIHHGRRAGEEEKTKIRVVSGETTLILQIARDISVVVAENNSAVKPKYRQRISLNKILSNF